MFRVLTVSQSGFYNWLKHPVRRRDQRRTLGAMPSRRRSIDSKSGMVLRELRRNLIPWAFLQPQPYGRPAQGTRFASLQRETVSLLSPSGMHDQSHRQQATTEFRCSGPEPEAGPRYHLHQGWTQMDLPGCSDGSVFAQDRRLGFREPHARGTDSRCFGVGGLPARHQSPILIHLDRGVKYQGNDYHAPLIEFVIAASMSRKGNC